MSEVLVPVVLPHQRGRVQAAPATSRVRVLEVRQQPVTPSTPLSEWWPGYQGSGIYGITAEDEVRWAYYSNVWVMACVRAIAEDVSSFPFRAGPDPEDPERFSPSAPLAQLLGPHPGVPAPGVSPRLWWQWIITQFMLTGQFAAEIVGTGRRVESLWPMPVSWLTPVPSQRPGEWWAGFRYGGWGSSQRILSPEQVLYYWHPSQDDWRKAESALQSARLDVSVAVMQDIYDYSFLRNDARPASVIVHERFAEVAQRDAFREKFQNDFAGPVNAGRPIFVESPDDSDIPPGESIKIIPIGLTQKDAEFIARYDRKLKAIRTAFGVPETRLGDTSDRTFTNAGQEYIVYFERLKTLADELAQAINTNLAPRIGNELGWFETTKLDDAVKTSKIASVGIVEAIKTRLMKINEARTEMGLEADPDGDRYLTDEELALVTGGAAQLLVAGGIPYSNAPADYVPKGMQPPPSELTPAPSASPEEPTPSAQPEIPPSPAAKTNGTKTAARRDLLAALDYPSQAELRARLYRRTERKVNELEETYRKRFQRLLDQQLSSSISRLEGKRGRQMLRDVRAGTGQVTVEDVFDPAFWRERTIDELRGTYDSIFSSAAQGIMDSLNVEPDVPFTSHSDMALQFIEHRVNQLAGNVTNTTYKGIRAALQEGAGLGESVPQLAARIEGLFKQTYASRAVTVARTEVLSAYNGASYATAAAMPGDVVAGMEWLATPGPRTRPAHRSADGQVVMKGETFTVGGHPMRYPGDPTAPAGMVVNCRCTLLVLTPEEYADKVPQVAPPAQIPVTPRARGRDAIALDELEDVLIAHVMPPLPEDGREQLISLEEYRARLA